MKHDPQKSKEYWHKLKPTIDSMLGGYQSINRTDYQGSINLLSEYFKPLCHNSNDEDKDSAHRLSAIDVGCGIGRVTKFVLIKYFNQVDLLEQEKKFLDTCPQYIGVDSYEKKIRKTFNCSMSAWIPDNDYLYDLIWLQWAIAYLHDEQLVEFLSRCKSALKPNGIMVIKDNVTSHDECDSDTQDYSTTRPLSLVEELIKKSGFSIIQIKQQTKFPRGLYPVYMFVLK